MSSKLKKRIARWTALFGMAFFLSVAGFWGHRGDVIRFALFLTMALIAALHFVGMGMLMWLDERFDRLEKLLGNRHQRKEEKTIEKDIDKSAEA